MAAHERAKSPEHNSSKVTDGSILIVWLPRRQYTYVLATLLATALLTTTLSVWQVRVNTNTARCSPLAAAPYAGFLMQLGITPAQGIHSDRS